MITLGTIGAFTVGLGNRTPIPGGSYAIGDLLLYSTGEYQGSDTLTFPDGSWTLLSRNTTFHEQQIYGKFATTTSEVIPTVTWGASNPGYAQLTTFIGVDPTFINVFTGLNTERQSNVTANIVGPSSALTPTQGNALLLFLGERNKTATSNGTTYAAPSNWTIAAQSAPNGTQPSVVVAYWIQTTATATAANFSFSGSVTDSSQAMQTTLIGLAAAASVAIPYPPTSLGGMNVQVCQ